MANLTRRMLIGGAAAGAVGAASPAIGEQIVAHIGPHPIVPEMIAKFNSPITAMAVYGDYLMVAIGAELHTIKILPPSA